jgi:uncharacterized protein
VPAAEREEVLRVESGGVSELVDVLDRIAAVQAEIEERLEAGRTPPADPDLDAVSAWATTAHRRHRGWAGKPVAPIDSVIVMGAIRPWRDARAPRS